jgi:hypothetical protein
MMRAGRNYSTRIASNYENKGPRGASVKVTKPLRKARPSGKRKPAASK